MKKRYRFTHRKGRAIQVMFSVDPGKWHSTGTEDMVDAVHWADSWLDNFISGGRGEACPTFGEYAKGFFSKTGYGSYNDYLLSRGEERSETHKNTMQYVTDKHLIPLFGKKRLDRLVDVDMEDAIMHVKSEKTGMMLSNGYRNNIIIALRIILRQAKRQHLIKTCPADTIPMLRANSKAKRDVTAEYLNTLFPKEDDKVVWNFKGIMWATYFSVMKDTGFRPGEVGALAYADWHEDLHGFVCKATIGGIPPKRRESIKTTNHGMGIKIGLVSDQTERLMKRLLEKGRNEDGLFFHTERGGLVRTDAARIMLLLFEERLGLEHMTQYALRHAFDTNAMKKLPMETVNLLMGHTGYRNEYDHRTGEDLLRQVQGARNLMFS